MVLNMISVKISGGFFNVAWSFVLFVKKSEDVTLDNLE